MGMGWLNAGSLVLGLLAWILPLVSLLRSKKASIKSVAVLSVASTGACAVSLFLQLAYTNYLVNQSDCSALLDTQGAVLFVAKVLLGVTLILNILALIVCFRKR